MAEIKRRPAGKTKLIPLGDGWFRVSKRWWPISQRWVRETDEPTVTELRTFGGEPSTPWHSHVGWPVDVEDVLRRARSGRTYYWPTDPVTID